jgi:hypothetical protein
VTDATLETRLASVVGGVLEQAVADAGVAGVVVIDDGTPESGLARRWAVHAIGETRVFDAPRVDALLAGTSSKTTLLLDARPAACDIAPLGDLYASQIERLAGGWHAPAAVRGVAELCGGVAALDHALLRWAERREPLDDAVDALPPAARQALGTLLRGARFARLRAPLVPKLSARTLGIDLFA